MAIIEEDYINQLGKKIEKLQEISNKINELLDSVNLDENYQQIIEDLTS